MIINRIIHNVLHWSHVYFNNWYLILSWLENRHVIVNWWWESTNKLGRTYSHAQKDLEILYSCSYGWPIQVVKFSKSRLVVDLLLVQNILSAFYFLSSWNRIILKHFCISYWYGDGFNSFSKLIMIIGLYLEMLHRRQNSHCFIRCPYASLYIKWCWMSNGRYGPFVCGSIKALNICFQKWIWFKK